jgi:hypothetical protein
MVKRYYNIKADIPKKEIYKRIGLKNIDELSIKKREEIETIIEQSFNRCDLKACYKRMKITSNKNGTILLDDKIEFVSNHFSIYVGDGKELFLLSVTAGEEVTNYRDQFISKEEALFALIADAVGSETVETGINLLQSILEKNLNREGKSLKKSRYSVGYGDFDIKNQKVIYNELELDRLNIKITESNILSPEKTITAFSLIL